MTQEDINEVMANSLKRYQLEHLVFDGGNIESAKRLIRLLQAENTQLKAQLTWRPVSEKPEISDKYYVIRKGFAITFRDICLFMEGEWCVNRVSEEHGGEYWQPIEKDNACPVVLWFPTPIIPPAPEGE